MAEPKRNNGASAAPGIANLAFVEALYEDYLRDPSSVSPDWQQYFSEIANGEFRFPKPRFRPSFEPASIFNPPRPGRQPPASRLADPEIAALQDRVYVLTRLYRVRGHRIAQVDPLGLPRPVPPELTPEFFGLTEADMDAPVYSETFQYDGPLTLGKLLERLRNTYCRSIGVQYMHIDDLSVRRWLQRRMESTQNRLQLSRDEQLRILTRLTDAVTFEEFIRRKFPGAKTFSLDGSESLIPLLDLAIEKAGEQGLQEIVLGMAHRGRLNVLANLLGKSARQIFREYADTDWKAHSGRGDVKYHLGHSTEWTTARGATIHLSLCFNPSHLEMVNPVALGRTRAKQDRVGDVERRRGMTLLIHGDAAFAGEGVVQETLNLSQLGAYSVGGTLHVVINNQIGFTTSPEEARSSTYATDVAKMLQVPIFHVNGEDPEAVAQVIRLAMDFRHEFKRDVVINMYGYRRLGHNEGDEPSFTQPVLYRAIAKRKSVREGYLEHLLQLGEVTRAEADLIASKRRELLERELSESQAKPSPPPEQLRGLWAKYAGGREPVANEIDTGIDREQLAGWLAAQTKLPDDFHPHPKIKKLLHGREQMAAGAEPLDWSAAESLAFGSLACAGLRVRLTGQDSERGTFSQRHAVLHDYQDGHTYTPLQHLCSGQAPVEIFNSPLSEVGVLGFEYGYSLDYPDGLVLWEAQFGDFWNVAQPIVDQFIGSAEEKWQRLSGLVLLLPHGFEGQGPEHSSARLERFLMLGAEDNLQVVYPTTPAQYFHCLRRQALRSWRKPLILITPKSLLRHPKVVSSLDDCARGRFERILPDAWSGHSPEQVRRVIFCAGKIYYDLAEHRETAGRSDVAILRLEQLYPLRGEELEAALTPYSSGTPVFWVQEEPGNMGAWVYLRSQFGDKLFNQWPFAGVTRPISASPATGSHRRHKQEQAEIIARAFDQAPGS